MIEATSGKLHWNYFIALERDLEIVSRYVEFSEQNFGVYSIEFAHLLFAAASEVDVIAKLLCQRLQPAAARHNIDDYRAVLLAEFPDLTNTQVFVPRYGLTLTPWENWTTPNNPLWWRSYNKVKHERDAHFHEATLKNALNALGALLILTYHHYSHALAPVGAPRLSARDTTRDLQPESTLLRFSSDYYHQVLRTTI
ncbi:MAG TPA: hypothetical protein VGV87_30100 [Blastocatellia bacterium]|nr:hypothetical protein [Blastocatellia bacterium]